MLIKLLNPKYYFKTFKKIILFICYPQNVLDKNYSFKENLVYVFAVGIITIVLVILSELLINYLQVIRLIEPIEPYKPLGLLKRYPFVVFLSFSGIIAPCLEELAFRLSLKFNRLNLSISCGVMGYYLSSPYLFNNKDVEIGINNIYRLLLGFTVFIVFYYLVLNNSIERKLSNFWDRNFKYIFYFSVLSFGMIHITNYELSLNHLLFIPIITLPQIILGIIFGFIRTKFGIGWSIVSHVFYNGVGILPLIIVYINRYWLK
ncbi:MAG: CPBP family glutamic-type intramembrane protease [Candidatus Celaenobacter antarcticus]|nr:CPBP family glutamic-type intramembrane protease [Candidatus Celaenobacter antarcticus]